MPFAPSLATLNAWRACAEAAARKAGAYALARVRRRREVHRQFAHDIKIKLDRECQDMASAVIRGRFPGAAILGEETPAPAAEPDPLWIIDPIDGTVNFFHGLPFWCCSVALQAAGRVVAGAVYAPKLDECYTAHLRSPATCNGKRIAVSATARLSEAIVLTGLNKRPLALARSADRFRTLTLKTRKVRILGSAALDLCQVAAGQADAYTECGIYLWDAAAGSLIVERAGGRVDWLERKANYEVRIAASNGRLQAPLRRLL